MSDDDDDRAWKEGQATSRGTFLIDASIPTWVSRRTTVAVKAWIDFDDDGILEEEDGELHACWLLYIR